MQQERTSGSSLRNTVIQQTRDKKFSKKIGSSGTADKNAHKYSRESSLNTQLQNVCSLEKNTKQNYPCTLKLEPFNDMTKNIGNFISEPSHITRSEYCERGIPVTPDAESGLHEDHSRKTFYRNIQERLLNVNSILDQYEVSSSSSSSDDDDDVHLSFESIGRKKEAIVSNDSEIKSTTSRSSSVRHPYFQSVQNTVASLCSHDEDQGSLGCKSDLNRIHSNREKLTKCQNPYYQSVQNLGGEESALNTVAPLKTIIYGYPESMNSRSRQRDDLTTLTGSESATILSGGTEFQIPNSANVAKILEDESLGPSLPLKSVPNTPDFSLASDEAVMGLRGDTNLNTKCTQSPNLPRKISFPNENNGACYTSLKDLVHNETAAGMQLSIVSTPCISLEDHVQKLTQKHECINQEADLIHKNDSSAPGTPDKSKVNASKYTDLDLVTTPLQSQGELRSPFKAVSKEGNEISRVKELDEYDDSDSSVENNGNTNDMGLSLWNEMDIQASSSLNLLQKKKCASQECACVIM